MRFVEVLKKSVAYLKKKASQNNRIHTLFTKCRLGVFFTSGAFYIYQCNNVCRQM